MTVRERKVLAIRRHTLPREPESGHAVFDTAADIVDVLRGIQQWRIVTADPSVHHESSTGVLVDPAEHRVSLRLKIQQKNLYNIICNKCTFT